MTGIAQIREQMASKFGINAEKNRITIRFAEGSAEHGDILVNGKSGQYEFVSLESGFVALIAE